MGADGRGDPNGGVRPPWSERRPSAPAPASRHSLLAFADTRTRGPQACPLTLPPHAWEGAHRQPRTTIVWNGLIFDGTSGSSMRSHLMLASQLYGARGIEP